MADIGIDDPQQLRDWASWMRNQVSTDFDTVGTYAREQGCCKDGFTGVFEVLKPVMDLIADAFDEGVGWAKDRVESTASGLDATADEYDRVEQGNENRLDNLN